MVKHNLPFYPCGNMKKILFTFVGCIATFSIKAQKTVEWVSTTAASQWVSQEGLSTLPVSGKTDVEIFMEKPLQKIEGFGAGFN